MHSPLSCYAASLSLRSRLCLLFWTLFFVWAGLFCARDAQAQSPPSPPALTMVVSQWVDTTAEVQTELPVGAALPPLSALQIAQRSTGQFLPYVEADLHDMPASRPLWLRIRVSAPEPVRAGQWVLRSDKPFLDLLQLYSPSGVDAQGLVSYDVQVAGDWHAPSEVSRAALSPEFRLPALAAGTHDLYLRVHNVVRNRVELSLVPRFQADQALHAQMFRTGWMVGALTLMALISLILAFSYGNVRYAWYAGYVVFAVMACVSVMGFGSYILWPQAIAWNDVSSHTFLLLALAMLVQFARVVFLGNPAHRAWRVSAIALSVALLATAVAVQGCGAEVIVVSVGIGVFLSSVWVFGLLIWRALRGDRLAWLWFAAYLPLCVLVSLTIVDAFGWISVPSLPVEATLYGLMFEMPLLLLGLVQHAKAAHTQRVQARALAAVDPETGFVPARAFYPLAEQQWNATLDARTPMVVAFVQVAHARGGSHQAMQAHAADPQREPTRVARLLRTVATDRDTVAHVDENMYALLMPTTLVDEALSTRMSRLIALGLMTDTDHDYLPLRFRVAVSSTARSGEPWGLMSERLHGLFRRSNPWGGRTVRFLVPHGADGLANTPAPSEVITDEPPSSTACDIAWQLAQADIKTYEAARRK